MAPASADALTARLVAAHTSGPLAQRVRTAGPNGAGKSTLYRAQVREGILGPPLEFVSADLHEREYALPAWAQRVLDGTATE